MMNIYSIFKRLPGGLERMPVMKPDLCALKLC